MRPKLRLFYHLDHLGTPRAITSATGGLVSIANYFPFGEELTAPPASEKLRFTGHERDALFPGRTDDMDYLHARHALPKLGRFLGTDKVDSAVRTAPQSWNRYGYARGNPIKYVDPDGKDVAWFARNDAGGGASNLGHSALRVFGEGYDVTYDFGRYRGGGLTGPGILKVWSDFQAFVAGQRGKGDSAVAQFNTSEGLDRAVMAYFSQKIATGTQIEATDRYTAFQLVDGYKLGSNNCTTICAKALAAGASASPEGQGEPLKAFLALLQSGKFDTTKLFITTQDPRKIYEYLRTWGMTPSEGVTFNFNSYEKR